MKNLKIKTKITLSFGVIVILCCVFAVLVIISNSSAINTLRGMTDSPDPAEINSVIAALNGSLTVIYIFAVVALAVAVILVLYLSGNISKPLGFLASAISGIAETGNIYLDDYAYKTSKALNARGDEIGKISRSVGDMLAMFRGKIQTLNAVADGDLTVGIAQRSSKDSIGVALTGMVESLNGMFLEIQSASGQVSAVSYRLADGADELAQGSSEQASTVEQLSSAISTIAGKTTQNVEMAKEAAGLSESIKCLAEKGGEQMSEMIDAVNKINEASDAISKVIKVIEDIAFQTNILALNAAVEAARAGQHGKGFAVVAQEVRNLATKSQVAAKDTGELIADSIDKAKLGSRIAGETAASLNEIVQGINKSSQLTDEIARSSDEQASEITRINTGIEQVNSVVKRNTETAVQSASASKEVSGQSALLQELIGKFKIKGQLTAPNENKRLLP